MARNNPPCKTARIFVRGRDKHALAPLTGQDYSAFEAFAHLLDLYARSDAQGQRAALDAMHATLMAMQPSTRGVAKLAIPGVLDWGDEEPLWTSIHALEHQP